MEKWNKKNRELEELKRRYGTTDGTLWDIADRICQEREEDRRTGTAGRKCIVVVGGVGETKLE